MAYVRKHEGIVLYALVGVFEWERQAVRPLVFDLLIESEQPFRVTRTIIEQQIAGWLRFCRYCLLEALAEYLAQHMLAEWACRRVILGIEKPGALGDMARVGVRISRGVAV